MTLIFTFPGMRGGLFHSSAALLPVTFAAAVIGLDTAVDWISRRRPSWRPAGAKHFFSISLLVLAAGLTTFIYNQRTIGDGTWIEPAWNRNDAGMIQIGEWLAAQQETDPVVMIGNPPAWYYHARIQAIVVPNEDVLRTLAAAHRYGASYLILDGNHPRPLSGIYQQTERHSALELAWVELRGVSAGRGSLSYSGVLNAIRKGFG